MTLLSRLNNDMKLAMKSKDKITLSVIRMVKASLQNELIKLDKSELTEEEELTILSSEVKQRKDSLHEFELAKRKDLVDKVNKELAILEVYMPRQLSDNELETIVQKTIQDTGSTSMSDMGKVMGAIMPKVKGKADGTRVKQLVKQMLT